MTCTALIRPVRSMMWELRGAWAVGRRVVLTLDDRCVQSRAEGHVTSVSPTDGWVKLGGLSYPADAILAVHHPSRLGDSTARSGPWAGMPRRRVPQMEELW